jgi:glyoxylase-like metal-dependent hydrolase (beta-lactamase superfamily II)
MTSWWARGHRHCWKTLWGTVMGCLVGLVYAPLASAQNQDVLTLVPKQVSPSVWYVEGESALGSQANKNFISNAAFIIGTQGVVVIDALGSPALAQGLINAVAKITPLKITHVVVTHYHADHIYGLQSFKKIGAKVVAHPAAKEYLNSETAVQRLSASRAELFPWIDETTQLVEADIWVDKDVPLSLAGIELLLKPAGPAHTPEDMIVYMPKDKVLFAGDLVFRGRIPFIGPTANTGPWLASLKSMLALGATSIVPGHGAVSQTSTADIEMLHDYLQYMRDAMRKAVQDLELFDEAYAATDWSRFEKLPLFKFANRMNAYNTYLQLVDQKKP